MSVFISLPCGKNIETLRASAIIKLVPMLRLKRVSPRKNVSPLLCGKQTLPSIKFKTASKPGRRSTGEEIASEITKKGAKTKTSNIENIIMNGKMLLVFNDISPKSSHH
jgi:uncharacterized protein YqfA (UPF0365 family)